VTQIYPNVTHPGQEEQPEQGNLQILIFNNEKKEAKVQRLLTRDDFLQFGCGTIVVES
jgi:hypothetical protein